MELEALMDAAINSVHAVVRPAIRAGAAQILSKESDIVAGDVVTDVDISIQAELSGKLGSLLAGSRVIGEEDFAGIDDPASRPTWILDPLDGTYNFARGFPCYGCSLALLVDASPVIAIVYDGVLNQTYDAISGSGSRKDGQTFKRDEAATQSAPAALSSGFINFCIDHPEAKLLEAVQRTSARYRVFGSQAIQLCWAAEGKLNLNISREAKLWDDAAGWLIIKEAGAAYERVAGRDLFPLSVDDGAVHGASLFSLAGSKRAIEQIAEKCRKV